MKILIIGGTRFFGRHFATAALARGHEVTLFHRGETNRGLFPGTVEILGDRDGQISEIGNRTFDAVVDTCGYVPRVVSQSVEFLKNSTQNYTFISSISVYPDFPVVGMDESSAVDVLPPDDTESEDVSKYYGPLKALCEAKVQEVFGDRALVVRPGLIVGPNDPTDRFTYWPYRISQGGDVLVPGTADRRVQFIDVRDLASFTLSLVEQKASGVYHATGQPVPMSELVTAASEFAVHPVNAVWTDEAFLADEGVNAWTELPLWIGHAANWPGFMEVSVEKAVKDGLHIRPLMETVRDTLEWAMKERGAGDWKAGLTASREQELLKAYRDKA